MIEQAYTLLVLALASARIAVLLVHDLILEKPRDWIFRHWPPMDNPMEGFDYQSKDKHGNKLTGPASLQTKRRWYLFSELLTCTRCMTVWITAVAWLTLEFIPASFSGFEAIAAMFVAAWGAKKL